MHSIAAGGDVGVDGGRGLPGADELVRVVLYVRGHLLHTAATIRRLTPLAKADGVGLVLLDRVGAGWILHITPESRTVV